MYLLTHNLEHYVNHILPLDRENGFKNKMFFRATQSKMPLESPFNNELHEAFYIYW